MKVISLARNPRIYTCNAYLVLGSWNRMEDINTLIDVGADASIIPEVESQATGVGKHRVEQIILTHCHFDHSGGAAEARKRFGARVLAYTTNRGADEALRDEQRLILGDRLFRVLHTPGHSQDSICLYCPEEKTLFSGDTILKVTNSDETHTREYCDAMEKIAGLDIRVIYSGHDRPVTEGVPEMLELSLKNIRNSRIV